MHTLYLQAVDSRYATEEECRAANITSEHLPPDWRVLAHQALTIKALRFGTAPIIINQAMTGDGKSFAGQFTLFTDGNSTLTMYPTKALADDQARAVEKLQRDWQPPYWRTRGGLRHEVLNADTLDKLLDDMSGFTRSDALQELLNTDFVLTNPDIFHLMMQFRYKKHGAARDLVLGDLSRRYLQFVFDEFHLFGVAQSASAMIAILLLHHLTYNSAEKRRFLFLSATPQARIAHMARLAGLEVLDIQGEYQHGLPDVPADHRRILQKSTLHLHSARIEQWVTDHLDDLILNFFAEHKGAAKGVIICNSVASAHRVHDLLLAACHEHHITLDLVTGIRKGNMDADLLVATSTVDVGVDFQINLLIFESLDAATHIQRLGRLGRHTKDRRGNHFEVFEAHALLPQWVIEGIAKEAPHESSLNRTEYQTILSAVYPVMQQFDGYLKRWAGLQGAHVLKELGKGEIKAQYVHIREALKPAYNALFPGGVGKYLRFVETRQFAILDEASAFRGGSPFTALVLDETNSQRMVLTYDLIPLLLNAELIGADMRELYLRAEGNGQSVKGLERAKPLAAYRLVNWLPRGQGRQISMYLDRPLGEAAERLETVIEQDGFRFKVEGSSVPELARLNNRLEDVRLVAFLIPHEAPERIRQMLRLGFQTELFAFRSADGLEGTVAFARDALLVDSVWYRRAAQSSDSPIFS